jgi:hypothetical protein
MTSFQFVTALFDTCCHGPDIAIVGLDDFGEHGFEVAVDVFLGFGHGEFELHVVGDTDDQPYVKICLR